MGETMFCVRVITNIALLIGLTATPAIPFVPLIAEFHVVQGTPMIVTSDTPEYCSYLLDRVSTLVRLTIAPVPREVTDLTTEGQRMCAHGQTRSGIMRLRSALILMEKDNNPRH